MSSVRVCRLCGSQSSKVVKVFTDNAPKTRTVVGEMMLDCLFATVEPDDGYPEDVCQFCHLQLNVFFEFKKKVMEQHTKFTSLLPVRTNVATVVTTIEKSILPVKQEIHSFSDKNCTQEGTTLQKKFKVEDVADEYDSDENLLEIMEADHDMDPSVDPNDYNSNYTASEAAKQEDEEDDEDFELLEEEFNAIEANEFEEEHLDEEPTEPTEYANDDADIKIYEPQDFEKQFLKSLETASAKPSKMNLKSKKVVNKSVKPDPKEDESYVEVEFIDENESSEYEEDVAFDETLNTPKKTTTIVGNQKKIAYQCRQCSKVFPTLAKFLQHVKVHRAKEKCKECNAMVFGECMSKHMAKHSEVKPFKCKECGKGFASQIMCSSHEYRHSNIRPFKCKLCEKAFKLGCDLRIHMNCHNDVRKYECEICNKTFRMHSHLANHRETHATENTMECEECGLMFKTTVTLKSHIRQLHSLDHAYKCSVCNRGFYRKNKLERHEQSHLRKMKKLKDALKKKENEIILDKADFEEMEFDNVEFVEDDDEEVALSLT